MTITYTLTENGMWLIAWLATLSAVSVVSIVHKALES